jgi:D-psicose/D-tagatose/L-ribulose 3-epimerase
VEVLRRLADQAGTSNVTLGIEIVNRYESNLVNTTDQALSLIADIGAPNVKVHLDTYHMNIEEPGFREPVLRCGEQLGYVHVGESHRGYLGSGTIDFDSFFTALGDVGYTGTIVFESFSSTVVAPELSNTLAIWRNTWSDGADLARAARAYIIERVGTPEAAHGTR